MGRRVQVGTQSEQFLRAKQQAVETTPLSVIVSHSQKQVQGGAQTLATSAQNTLIVKPISQVQSGAQSFAIGSAKRQSQGIEFVSEQTGYSQQCQKQQRQERKQKWEKQWQQQKAKESLSRHRKQFIQRSSHTGGFEFEEDSKQQNDIDLLLGRLMLSDSSESSSTAPTETDELDIKIQDIEKIQEETKHIELSIESLQAESQTQAVEQKKEFESLTTKKDFFDMMKWYETEAQQTIDNQKQYQYFKEEHQSFQWGWLKAHVQFFERYEKMEMGIKESKYLDDIRRNEYLQELALCKMKYLAYLRHQLKEFYFDYETQEIKKEMDLEHNKWVHEVEKNDEQKWEKQRATVSSSRRRLQFRSAKKIQYLDSGSLRYQSITDTSFQDQYQDGDEDESDESSESSILVRGQRLSLFSKRVEVGQSFPVDFFGEHLLFYYLKSQNGMEEFVTDQEALGLQIPEGAVELLKAVWENWKTKIAVGEIFELL